MILLAIVTFFVTVFVVVQGAALAGINQPSADFVVLSATILVASTILAGIMNN
jgi:Na+/H+ antiporter NhaD/arsenite permease-like protein